MFTTRHRVKVPAVSQAAHRVTHLPSRCRHRLLHLYQVIPEVVCDGAGSCELGVAQRRNPLRGTDSHAGPRRRAAAFSRSPRRKGTVPSGSGWRGRAWENRERPVAWGSFSKQEAVSRLADRLSVRKS